MTNYESFSALTSLAEPRKVWCELHSLELLANCYGLALFFLSFLSVGTTPSSRQATENFRSAA